MVHPTPTLIPQVAFTLHRLPAGKWCNLAKAFRPLSAWEEMEFETGKIGTSQSSTGTIPIIVANTGQSPSANSYPLPPTVIQSQSGAGSGQRQKQLNNTIPVPPPATPTRATTVKSKAPAPMVCWNDHLRML